MTADFEKFSRIVLEAVHDFREEFAEHHEEMTDFRAEMLQFRTETTQRMSGIERELAEINRQLDRLEQDVADIRGYAKELDELRSRIRAVETHLGIAQHI